MTLPDRKVLILFDGYCHLCSWVVRRILKTDKAGIFLFAPINSETGEFWKRKLKMPQADSVVLVEADAYFLRSEAALKIAGRLGGSYRLLLILRVLPLSWRDKLYDRVARNRFRWFGRRQTCFLPKQDERQRFL
ncbi:MAG: thiol-disulfide oxidoreductase DCC family protein [Mangrovibacterium sp.]